MIALTGLFLAALLAATVFPAQSEAVLVILLRAGDHPVWLLLAVATAGNVLGSVVNCGLGRFLLRFADRRWFPSSGMKRAQAWYRRYGHWSLWLCWVPVVGDPLTVVAGAMREPLWRFLTVVLLAKAGRYVVLAAITLAWFQPAPGAGGAE
ncbi:YqaA family protein [Paenirhodobacter populi]|uniref:DedA family protein n=1 Tax=Paenirhodobacter populi TaxID=2306993 RepID=A0A443JDU7_9RHOB|nr:YqaA family protein [Sinirhodobacter populi]RWR18736.1 DedA family protein [Sinirhodobacter populi]